MAAAVCDRHRDVSDRSALFCETASGKTGQYTFEDLYRLSNKLANVLISMGVAPRDRIAILLPQRIETGLCHLAAWKIGAISLPLSVLFGTDALRYRLEDSGAKVVIGATEGLEKIQSLRDELPELDTIIDCDDEKSGFWPLLDRAAKGFETASTLADDPAIVIYTSGTTGPPKGAMLAHRCLLGNLTGFEMSQNFFPRQDDLMWTPADWAWTGGLLDGLIPAWFYGCPVLGYDGGRFDPEKACDLMARHRVRNAFIPPTALKMLRQVGDIRGHGVQLRSVMSAGESLGAQIYEWAEEALGIQINEMWGQTEFNYIVGNCSTIMPVKPGSMGKSYPGHRVEPLDDKGNVLADGEIGELCALRDDPVMFLGYWKRDQATRDKFIGPWWSTGDVGYRDSDGYLWFVGRKDDVISSAGHRIGPGEIEDCMLKHPAVVQAAAVGAPDELRGEIVKAFIVLASGAEPSDALAQSIQDMVRGDLAAYEYPREIEFVSELPMTTTGKVRRIELREREIARKRKS
ncbi:MAG: AMP-binding protein [Arenicellales bacterium]|nr:AMP-binding protein [Arenicellales bacterium]MDP6552761.1 AMP-binding protein [Arenicellales bacterium]MDP6791105.1 AMP-binding protein [Arenicellales bacterium]MDP6918895.1 AMP-binding protein [Arenicellales bacterium]